jgi:2-oxoglutarate dehydrogenase E1 component
MVCYRRHGHNEGDDPSFTQPLMYRLIEGRRSVRKLYTETLVRRGDITADEAEKALDDFLARMQTSFEETRQSAPPPVVPFTSTPVVMLPPVDTGVNRAVLDRIAGRLHTAPEGFSVHPKLAKVLEARHNLYREGQIDWSLGEALAFGSLLLEGVDVRLAGQDTRRGTFSQRHSVLVDSQTGSEHVPLANLDAPDRQPATDTDTRRGRFRVYDSLLSEYAALGFEYGYSVVHTEALVAWEAQFGDFGNGAQVVIDQFIAAAESKWGQRSGLVLLLPHGFEGQGPEHSSARMERFLTLCANENMQVVNATSAAQYFHVLRRQIRRVRRRPLIVLTPKSLLRAHSSRSPVEELVSGRFHEVLDDPAFGSAGDGPLRRDDVTRVVLASGKVALDAIAQRDQRGLRAAVVRVEQLYPWPGLLILDTVSRYPGATEVVWLQEEPENMGGWNFVSGRLTRLLPEGVSLRHVSRRESASPASGSLTVHQHEQAELLERTFVGL